MASATSISPGELRHHHKVSKRRFERKSSRGADVATILEAIMQPSTDSDDTQDGSQKKHQGIVIDGRTYTCATCKSGHRVGICKHAGERPMTATHPPGRPPAGAPKKIVCDCPKQCGCKKRDCKCARKCSCTQPMYMLVYVPAPGEDEEFSDERGSWRLGQQVTTDLKGNILTDEQIKERQEQKQAQKTATTRSRTVGVPTDKSMDSRPGSSRSGDPKPKAEGGCCKHKENIVAEAATAEKPPARSVVSRSFTAGCNCGTTCGCAFCPQHPNNHTSTNMARQQAMHFANQGNVDISQSIVSFSPAVPQELSCMGGLPQFAIGRFPERPTFSDLQRTFPHPGYVISYPLFYTPQDGAEDCISPFDMQPHHATTMPMGMDDIMTGIPAPALLQDQPVHPYNFSSDDFGVGNAFVTSGGPSGWDKTILPPTELNRETLLSPPQGHRFAESLNLMPCMPHIQDRALSHDTSMDYADGARTYDESSLIAVPNPVHSERPPNLAQTPFEDCCDSSITDIIPEGYEYDNSYISLNGRGPRMRPPRAGPPE